MKRKSMLILLLPAALMLLLAACGGATQTVDIPTTEAKLKVQSTVAPAATPTQVQSAVAPAATPTQVQSTVAPAATPTQGSLTPTPAMPGPHTSNLCGYLPDMYREECEEMFKRSTNFGHSDSNSGDYVQSYDPENIAQIARFNFTELGKYSRMSKLRSAVGHDYSFNTSEYDPTGSNCRSMKHYFVPMSVPRENYLYSKTPHAFEWMSIKFLAPVDGTLQDVIYTHTSYGTEAQFAIRSSAYPGYYFNFYHIALEPDLTEGTLVKGGQLIGKLGNEEAWGEIAVEARITSRESHFISFLQVAADNVLEIYKNRGVNTASDVIITKEQRDAYPLACDDSESRRFEGSGMGGTKSDERFITWAFESSDNWFFFDKHDQREYCKAPVLWGECG